MPDTCQHLDQIDLDATATSPDQCLTCTQMGDEWVNLRMCCICGNVGCCDSSKNKHSRSSQTKCNTLRRCCHGTTVQTYRR
jgi:hypothetical protein